MNNGEISFKKKALQSYREEAHLEKLSSLSSVNQQECDNNDGPKKVLITTPPSSAVVFQLFQYLKPEFIALLQHRYDDILKSIKDKCNLPSLWAYIEKQQSNINLILKTMTKRFLLEILMMDYRGGKFGEIQARFEELFFLRERDLPMKGCKANFVNTDTIESLITRINKESKDPENDDFYKERSGTRRRGRTPLSEIDKKPNRVDAIKSDYILSCKSLPPVVYNKRDGQFYIDYTRSSSPQTASTKEKNNNLQYLVDTYPIFEEVIDINDACIPTPNNHGFYTHRIRQALRRIPSSVWPMRGLMLSLLNAEAILKRTELILPKSLQTYYCAYSGERLMEGEKVWHIVLLVNSGRRYKKWIKDGITPTPPNTSPEFTRSLKTYFIKSRITAQCSIFYSPMDPEYRKQCLQHRLKQEHQLSSLASKPQHYVLPHNRQVSVNILWYTLSQMRSVLSKNRLEQFIQFPFQPKIGKLPFTMLMEQYTQHIKSLSEANDPIPILRVLIFISTIPWFNETSLENEQVSAYVDMIQDVLLDFVELQFPFTEVSRTEPFPIPHERRVLNFPLLGLPLPQTPKDVLGQIKPRLGNTLLLGKLLELCDKRGPREIDLDRLERSFIRHPCFYLAFFYQIYQQQHDASQQNAPSLSVYFKLLSRMNLIVETTFSS